VCQIGTQKIMLLDIDSRSLSVSRFTKYNRFACVFLFNVTTEASTDNLNQEWWYNFTCRREMLIQYWFTTSSILRFPTTGEWACIIYYSYKIVSWRTTYHSAIFVLFPEFYEDLHVRPDCCLVFHDKCHVRNHALANWSPGW